MRPVLLIIKAFGPFSNEQIIDFSLLEENSFFLIHGPTGAGKTSILDAICFALYGQTSISDRSVVNIRSHHADPSVQTEISLTFSIGKSLYRVIRIPEQNRPKSRGSGYTCKASTATLEQQFIDSDNIHWKIIADRWNRVTEKIESILGFRCDQFRQVVILPQGEFRKLLNSSSQERQSILATLFRTEWYRQIEDALRNRAKEIKNTFEKLNTQLQLILNDCSCDSLQILSDQIISIKQECVRSEDVLSGLRIKEKSAQHQLTESRNIKSKFDALDNAERDYDSLELQKENFKKIGNDCEKAERALLISRSHELLNKLRNDFKNIQIRRIEAQNEFTKAQLAFFDAQKQIERLPEFEKQREESKFHFEYLKSMLPKVHELSEISNKFSEHSKIHTESKKSLQQGKEHLEKVKTALKMLRDQATILQDESSRVESLSNELRILENQCSIEKQKKDIKIKIETVEKSVIDNKNDYLRFCETVIFLKNDIERQEQLLYQGSAAILASTLKENCPCPVCGSENHPRPAKSNVILPDEKKIKQLKDDLKKKETLKENKKNILESVERKLSDHTKELSLLVEQSASDIDITSLESKCKECSLLLDKAKESTIKLKNTFDSISRGEKALITAEEDLEKLTEKYTESISSYSSMETYLKTLENEIPASFRDIENTTTEEIRIENNINELNRKISAIRTDFEESGNFLSSNNATLTSIQQQENDIQIQLNSCTEKFSDEMKENGFSNESEYLSSLQRISEISDMKKKLNDFMLNFHAAEDRKKRAQNECENLQMPDLSTFELNFENIQKEIASNISSNASHQQRVERLIQRQKDCKQILENIEKCESDYKIAGHLASVSSGDNPLRITFERFILSTLLDEVLCAGTRRLTIMSRNRYTLHRALIHNDQRTAGGLDLMVFDSYTGTSRPVGSLSGGESFLAALSLALGLADVVQSYSGGIHLDALFIDEGFGSLDSEALDCAFQALTDLGRDGRMVGIISHVAELKEIIETRLEISSGKNGSSLKLKV